MTTPTHPKKPAADKADAEQHPDSEHQKHKPKTGDDEKSDLTKIIWDRIGPLTIDPLK